VNAFVGVLDLDDLGDADRERILGPLHEAERKADRRGKGEAAPDPAGAPKAPEDPAAKKPG
jgi:hypothetical protein